MIRADYSNLYNMTVLTNKEVRLYLNQQLVFNKPQEVRDTKSFQIEFYRHQMMHFEAFIADTQRKPDELG